MLIDDPVAMRDAYAAGEVHIGWATLDMVPLFMEGFVDATASPRTAASCRASSSRSTGRTAATASSSATTIKTVGRPARQDDRAGPELAVALLRAEHARVTAACSRPRSKFTFTQDAFQAAAAFNADKIIAACVTWAPDIYNLERGRRATACWSPPPTANKLIADVWFARADFAKDHPDICEGLVRGIFDAMVELKDDAGQAEGRQADGRRATASRPSEALAMLGDAHSTNYAENREFFLNQNNPTNFERIWNTAYYLYRRIGAITHQPVPFDQVMDFSIIKKLGKEPKYATQQERVPGAASRRKTASRRSRPSATRSSPRPSSSTSSPTAGTSRRRSPSEMDGKDGRGALRPERRLRPRGDRASWPASTALPQIVIEGHTDASMKGRVSAEPGQGARRCNRANAVKEALVSKFKPRPEPVHRRRAWAGTARPTRTIRCNHAKNRRVEIKVYPPRGE